MINCIAVLSLAADNYAAPMHSAQLKTTPSPLPEWYEIYLTAVLEPDESKALLLIERASKAMAEHLVQLQLGAPPRTQEFEDLRSALTYLRLLFEHINTQRRVE